MTSKMRSFGMSADTRTGSTGAPGKDVRTVEQMVRLSRELYRDVASGEQAKAIYQIGTDYGSTDETLARLGYAPNRQPGERGAPLRRVA